MSDMPEPIPTLTDGPADAAATLILAHGAGAPMDHPFLAAVAAGLGERGARVVRFDFPYTHQNRLDGRRRPPNPMPTLERTLRAVVDQVAPAAPGRLFIGGKSMGGRVASRLVDALADSHGVQGLVVFGYPFHPPGKPERLRTAHLESMRSAALILQGERDPFGRRGEVEGYALSATIALHWSPDGDHGLKPRKRSGRTEEENLSAALDRAAAFLLGG